MKNKSRFLNLLFFCFFNFYCIYRTNICCFFNIFSFTLIIPVLKIIFQMEENTYSFIPWGTGDFKETLVNNFYWFVSSYMGSHGPVVTLLVLAGVLILMTALTTSCY